jgi:putative transposase
MPRKLRVVVPGSAYHVYARGNDRREIARDDEDFLSLERLTLKTIRDFGWACWAYTLMPNHLHLVVEIREANLSRGMQRLLGRYAQLYNDRHERSGHLFQGRFDDRILDSNRRRANAIEYVLDNAVAAELASSRELWPYTGGVAATWRAAPPRAKAA